MPEGVGMNVGQIILCTEAIQPCRNAVRVHPGAVIPYEHIGSGLPSGLRSAPVDAHIRLSIAAEPLRSACHFQNEHCGLH